MGICVGLGNDYVLKCLVWQETPGGGRGILSETVDLLWSSFIHYLVYFGKNVVLFYLLCFCPFGGRDESELCFCVSFGGSE